MANVKKNVKNLFKQLGVDDKSYANQLVKTAQRLLELNQVEILSHRAPDGDTLGSAVALCRGLRSLGKRANVVCADMIPQKYQFLLEGLDEQQFQPTNVVSVDIAAPHLLGKLEEKYAGKIDVAIDHHMKNSMEAPLKWVDEESAAVGEMIWMLLTAMGVTIDKPMAEAMFTAITTDTGCFKYSNVTARTHQIAVELMKYGIDCAGMNFRLLDEVTKAQLGLKSEALSTLEYYCDDKCAIVTITSDMMEKYQASPEDTDGVSNIPRSVQGVQCGITMKQVEDGWKISIRSDEHVNAAEICGKFGGGGHARAAGCKFTESYEEAKQKLVAAVEEVIKK
ncbi:MAG: bifunctional oligoribonuclease/PAP phosphatase NrnA [Clostridia bacterium]|nr:bifunctional oligoribonuclease/PAP phosphatase NrnA [Clostridia bacterium]